MSAAVSSNAAPVSPTLAKILSGEDRLASIGKSMRDFAPSFAPEGSEAAVRFILRFLKADKNTQASLLAGALLSGADAFRGLQTLARAKTGGGSLYIDRLPMPALIVLFDTAFCD